MKLATARQHPRPDRATQLQRPHVSFIVAWPAGLTKDEPGSPPVRKERVRGRSGLGSSAPCCWYNVRSRATGYLLCGVVWPARAEFGQRSPYELDAHGEAGA